RRDSLPLFATYPGGCGSWSSGLRTGQRPPYETLPGGPRQAKYRVGSRPLGRACLRAFLPRRYSPPPPQVPRGEETDHSTRSQEPCPDWPPGTGEEPGRQPPIQATPFPVDPPLAFAAPGVLSFGYLERLDEPTQFTEDGLCLAGLACDYPGPSVTPRAIENP